MPQNYSIYQLENMAEAVLKQTGFLNENVDVVKLANILGFNVYQAYFSDDVSGKVVKEEKAIYINRLDKPERQRFSIAHEIAHILLHHKGEIGNFIDYRNKGIYNQQEFEADNFAAALLMPKNRSIEVWQKYKDVDDFAFAMKVSRAAASIRLINLGLI